jgi:hypothetical protein
LWVDQNGTTYTREQLKGMATSINKAIKLLASEGKFLSVKEKEEPKLREQYHLQLNGATYSTLSHKERKVVINEDGTKELVENIIVVGKDANGNPISRVRSI